MLTPRLAGGFFVLAAAGYAASGTSLVEAIKDQGGRPVPQLLEQHVDVNEVQPDGATPLSWAAYLDQAATVNLLLKAGAKVNVADEYGDTPLTLACATGDAAVIGKLIAAGADAKAARWNGETALMIAARSGTVPGVKLLLEHGALIDATETRKGQNALMWAAAEGHSEVVDLLIASGAHVKSVSSGGFTPLVFAAQKGDAKSVKSLLNSGLDPNYKLPNRMSVLQVAVLGDKTKVADVLLANGSEANTADKDGNTPLHLASQSGNLPIVKALLASGANPNALTAEVPVRTGRVAGGGAFRQQSGKQPPLFFAARANHKDVMEALVAAGADPKLKAQDGTTLLMAAANSAHLAAVEYAYQLDPDVLSVTARKSTVMHAAISVNLAKTTQAEVCKVVQFLADKGAEPDMLDANGRTPIAIANIIPIDHAVTLLEQLIVASGKSPKISAAR